MTALLSALPWRPSAAPRPAAAAKLLSIQFVYIEKYLFSALTDHSPRTHVSTVQQQQKKVPPILFVCMTEH